MAAAPRNRIGTWLVFIGCAAMVLAAVAGSVTAFLVTAWLIPRQSRRPSAITVMEWKTQFVSLRDRVFKFIIANDGYIPADPYRGLIEAGEVESYREFMFGDHAVVFRPSHLPVRLNIEIPLNRPLVFFWLWGPGGERWLCFTNGSWERWGDSEKWVYGTDGTCRHVAGCQPEYDFEVEASQLLKKAGHPSWPRVDMKRRWIESNKSKLVWNAALGMYTVGISRSPKKRRPTETPGDSGETIHNS